ncbi:MAG: zinc-dependent peptidase [Leptodesmis sp.]
MQPSSSVRCWLNETFFEKPSALQQHAPALYGLLQYYYHLDPVQWL